MTSNISDKLRVVELISIIRLRLYNTGKSCGAKVIHKELLKWDVRPIPSPSTIGRILRILSLTHGRTGHY